MKKRLLSLALIAAMLISLFPAALKTTTHAADTDAFGITMSEWSDTEKAAAEADLPFGTGYGTWTTLLEKNELFFSMGYDSATRLTGLFDWSTEGATVDTIVNAVDNFGQSKLTSEEESYKAVATAAMDLNGTGKKEYMANLALNTSNKTLTLYVTDSNNNRVGNGQQITFENVAQLSSMEVHQLNGAFSIAAGDFDGDGKDTIVVYVPQTDGNKYTQNGTAPIIAEYFMGQDYKDEWHMVKVSTVSSNVLQMLGNNEINQITTMKNQPMVDLVAEDTDKDGFDELIVTAGMNDVTNSDHYLESHIFIYDQQNSGSSFTWNRSYDKKLAITSESNKRVVWASSTVGNIMVNTSTTSVDYPEIITAGFIDDEQSNTQHINVGGSDDIGVTAVRVKSIKNKTTKNVICEYEEVLNQKISPNGWTKGGFYESEDVNGLLQVQAFADRGLEQAESVFISGSVYRINSKSKLAEAYKHGDFNSKDDFAPGGRTLTNTTVTAVTAGNFDGNDEGREQLLCVTTLKQSGKNNAYSRVYCYYAEDDGTCNSKRSNYLTEHKGNFYVSLAALDTDNDSIIAKLESVSRDYSAPDVLAILEASPYFAEINDSFGNSETTYGKASSSGNGATNSFGFTLGVSVGYEFESDLAQSGGGFELALDRSFNWATANSTTVEWFTEFRNDSGENLVVVYRCPVVTYQYVDQNGKELVVEKVGQPATSMITVDEYNEASDQYDSLEPIDETNANLGDAGDPFSYRSTVDANTMKNAVVFNGAGEGKWDSAGWTQYSGSGSVMQGLTITKEQEKTFSFDLDVSLNVFAKAAGVTASRTFGFTYGYEQTHISGSSVTKSGAVTGAQVAGYDFQWKFAAWNCTLNGSTVPVLGYLVKDVVAPPSPAMGLTAESFTTDSVTLRWSSGTRDADQYRIYRVRDTAPQYVLVGAVQGDETSFELTGLKPGETYTYVVRGVGFTNAGAAVESVDSAPITVRTQSEDSKVTLSLHSSSLTGSTLQSTGAAADLSVQVTGTSSGSLYYQWQLLEPLEKGVKHGWLNVNTLAGDTIGTVTGATSGSLTLKNIDKSLDGSYLRCVVTANSPAGDVETYYSPVVTLDLSGLDTTTTISVTGNTGGSGSASVPYTGMANYTTVENKFNGSYINVPATVEQGVNTYTIYQDKDANAYVGVCDTVDTVTGTSSRTYYAVTKSGDDYTLGSELTLADDQYIIDNTSDYTIPTGFDGTSILYEKSDTVYYEKRYLVDSTGSSITLTEYWFNTSDGKYYTRTEENGTVTFTLANSQPGSDADLRMVYYDQADTVILSADGDDSYDHYQVYTVNNGSEVVYTAGVSFYRLPGTKLYQSGVDEPYADSAKLTTVTVQQKVLSPVTTSVLGTQLTLSAFVAPRGGTISFTITNTDTGVVTQITAGSDGKASWTAPKAGLYRIVATASATATTKSSSDVCYYRADDPNSSYRLIVKQGGTPVTNISYNGSPVTVELKQRTDGTTWDTVSGVSYKVNDTAFSGSSYTPGAAGNYLFSAVVNGKTVATAVLVVNKVAITVTPTWEKAGGATNTVPDFNGIELVFTDAQGNPVSGLDGYMKVSCDLYDGSGNIKSNATSGVYTVTPVFVSDTKDQFLSRYNLTINTDKIYYFSDAITVYFSAGENGKVYARYIDPSGTEFSFNNGTQISMDYGLKFVAESADGWSVGTWKVTAGDIDVTNCFSTYIDTLLITSGKMDDLKTAMGTSKTLNVLVTFTDQTHQITYNVTGGTGSLSAMADNLSLTSGAYVASDATVTFTAVPGTGKMVDKWIVDGAEYKWDGTDALYRENTLTLENISSDHDVQVSFTNAATTDVKASAVEASSYVPYTNATVTVTNAQGNTLEGDALKSVPQSSALTFTATIDTPSSAVVMEWQTSTDGNNWTTVTGSGSKDSITIYEHSEKLYVRVVISVSQTYALSWNVAGLAEGDSNKATLVAKSGDTILGGNGNSYASNIPVTFTLDLDGSYYVTGWSSNVTPAEDNKSATLTLTDDTTVTVNVAKKPIVTWTEPSNGNSITVTGTVNGAEMAIQSGDYVDPNTTITVEATPGSGYVVNTITAGGNAVLTNTDKSNGVKTTDPIAVKTSNVNIDATFLAKPTVTFDSTPTGGTVSVTGTVDGTSATITDGSYVDFGTNVTITATPTPDGSGSGSAYVVNTITADGSTVWTNTDKSNGAKTTDPIAVETSNVTIGAAFLAKPVVTIDNSSANGAVEVKGTKDGTENATITNGDYVDFNTDLSVTLTPNTGFEVGSCKANGTVLNGTPTTENPDGKTYTISSVQAKQTITPVWSEIPQYSLTLSAETIDAGGAHGSISANVTRKGLADYTQSNVTSFYRDSDLEIVPAPDPGYRVQSYTWTIADGTGNIVESRSGENLPTGKLKNVQGDVSITVRFVKMNDGVTFGPTAADREDGYISSATVGGTNYLPNAESGFNLSNGATLELGVTLQPGYEVEGWYQTVGGGTETLIPNTAGAASYTYTSNGTTSAIYLSVKFRQVKYPVTWGGTNGTVSAKDSKNATLTSGESIRGGETVTFTATPKPGYEVTGWTVNDAAVTDETGAKVTGTTFEWTVPNGYLNTPAVTAYKIKALFNLATYTVNYNSQPDNGSLSATVSDGASVAGNTVVTFTATPNEHYEVDKWTVNDADQTAIGNKLEVTVTANTTVAVTFKLKQYTVTVTNPSEDGKATASPDTSTVTANTNVTFTASPATGYELKEWLVNGKSTPKEANDKLTLTITENTTVQPVFKKLDITINYTLIGTEGTITAKANGSTVSNGRTVPYGSNVTLKVTPTKSTDMVSFWMVGDTVVKQMTATADAPMEYTIENVTGAQAVEVELVTRPTYRVTAGTEGGGTVAITGDTENTGSVKVSRNGSVTITATENSYYQFKEWLVNGVKSDETGRTLTLENIKADTTVTAVFFEAGLFKVMFEDVTDSTYPASSVAITADGKKINPGADTDSSVSVVGGSKLIFAATPATGFMVAKWTVNDVVQDNLSNTLTIDKLTESTTVTVEFEPLVEYKLPNDTNDYHLDIVTKNPKWADGKIRQGGDVTFTVKPETGKTITDLQPSAGTATRNNDGSYTVTVENVTADITLAVTVTDGIPLTIYCGDNGTLTVKRGDGTLAAKDVLQVGDELTITASPASGYQLSSLTVNDATISSGSSYTVTADDTALIIAATFTKITTSGGGGGGSIEPEETIILTPAENGTLTASDKYAAEGDTLTITAKPDAGYELESLTATDKDGKALTLTDNGDGTFTLTVPAEMPITITAVFAEEEPCDGIHDCPSTAFQDLDTSAWYHLDTDYVITQGLMNGTSKTTFEPNSTLDRAMVVTILYRLEGEPEVGSNVFTDVEAGQWYTNAVIWAAENGVVEGYGDGLFGPEDPITREQIATILYRYAKYKGYNVTAREDISTFTDGADTSDWAKTAMSWAKAVGLVNGKENNMLDPLGNATRAEAAALFHRFCEKVVK